MNHSHLVTVMDAAPVRAIDSSTDAAPIVVTDVAHGLATGDTVTVFGHATNTAANGTWQVTRLTADTFSLDGSTGNGVGGGTGVWAKMKSPGVLVQDAESISVTFDTDGGGDAAFVFKVWTSDQEDCPDPAVAQSASNQYDFVDMIDKEDGASIDGDTGVTVATADDHRQFELNVANARWAGVLMISGTAGEATIKFRTFIQTT